MGTFRVLPEPEVRTVHGDGEGRLELRFLSKEQLADLESMCSTAQAMLRDGQCVVPITITLPIR